MIREQFDALDSPLGRLGNSQIRRRLRSACPGIVAKASQECRYAVPVMESLNVQRRHFEVKGMHQHDFLGPLR
jgi:hypothetical protein